MCERRAWRSALCVALGLLGVGASAQTVEDIRLSGYYKNLLLRSKTLDGAPYTLDLNRLRLEIKGQPSEALAFELQVDNEVLLGSYLRTADFQQRKDVPPPQYGSVRSNAVERRDLYGTLDLYRAHVQFTHGDADVRIGRQRIAWGTGRFWSPSDLLNPFSPLALEREERLGVDAVLAQYKLGPVSRVAAVVAPSRRAGETSSAVQWHDNASGLDYSLTAGRFRGDRVIGLDLAGQVGPTGVRAELTRTVPRHAPAFVRALVGIDHAFANTLTLTAEVYRDGSGARDPAAYDLPALQAGTRQTLAHRYAGLHARYEITPLLKATAEIVINLDDRSRFLAPRLSYSWHTDLDVAIEWRLFRGAAGSEYGRLPNAAMLSLQAFF
jgi:hypothetical protein